MSIHINIFSKNLIVLHATGSFGHKQDCTILNTVVQTLLRAKVPARRTYSCRACTGRACTLELSLYEKYYLEHLVNNRENHKKY